MIKAITKLIIATAGLWLALPAVAQFEIAPDHLGEPTPTVVQPHPEQSKASMRISLPYAQVPRHRVQAFKVTKSSTNAMRALSSAAADQHHRVAGGDRIARRPGDRKASEQSQLALPRCPYEWVPQ